MSMLGGMFASAGSQFLNSLASSHGDTFGSRTMRPYQNFETPWGKGPYWSEELMNRRIQGRVADAKAAGIHPLFAMGHQGVGGTVSTPHRPSSSGAGPASMPTGAGVTAAQRQLNELAVRRQRVALERDNVELMQAQSELQRMQAINRVKIPSVTDGFENPPMMEPPEVMTKKNVLRGPFGGVYEGLENVSPQREWEDRIGEASDWTAGPAIAFQLMRKREQRLRRQRNNVRAALRARARKKYPLWERFKREISKKGYLWNWSK